jgi:hypothetical protein
MYILTTHKSQQWFQYGDCHSPGYASAGGPGLSPNPFPRMDFSIGFTQKTKNREITFGGLEKGPLPRMQQFSILVTDKKSFWERKKFSSFTKEFFPT